MDKVALVTGASSGIGFEIADILAAKGYNLFIVSMNETKLDQAKKRLQRPDIKVESLAIDLSTSGAAEKVFAKAKNMDVEVLVNNAGFGLRGESVELDPQKVQAMLTLNIITLTELSHLFGKVMKEKKSGYILNIASVVAYQPVPLFSAYAASKSYVLNFSESLAKELEDYNVVVTALSPGATNTGFFTGMGDSKALRERTSPRYVAEVGVKALFAKKLSIIPGFKNKITRFVQRFLSRKMIAQISKKLMYK